MTYSLIGILLLFFSLARATAGEIMFEGYYRIDLDDKPIGYSVLRYEFEPKAKTFQVTSFVRAKLGNDVIQESFKGKASDRFEPLNYQYTSIVGQENKMIDASFKGQIMEISISNGKQVRKETHKIPKGTFFSSFLPYMLLQKKLELNQAFKYEALAEEEGNVYTGKSMIEAKEKRGPYEIFKVLNSFKGEEFISQMAVIKDPRNPEKNIKGEVFGTDSPAKKISTHLVNAANGATQGQIIPTKVMTTLFGGMPTGKLNLVATPPEKPAEK